MTDRRIMPHHAEAEASILGGIILRRENLLALGHLQVEDFYDLAHRVVFGAIRNLEARVEPIDVVTLEREIANSGKLDAIGGVAFLGELTLRVPTADNVEAYARIVRQQSLLRTLMLKGGAIAEAGYNFTEDADEFLDETIADLQRLQREHRAPAKVPPGFAPMSERASGEREERLAAAARGLRYHHDYLDDRLRMILPHDLVIITARSGAGKTQAALSIAMANAVAGHATGLLALEAEPRELERRTKYGWLVGEAYRRNLPRHTELNFSDWLVGECEDIVGELDAEADEWFRRTLSKCWTFYKGLKRFDSDAMVQQILDIAKTVELIVLDHLHYVDARDGDTETRAQSRLAHTLRDVALDVGRPVIAVAHLRKPVGPVRTLLPSYDEIMGSSDLSKIPTHVIALATARFVEPAKWWHAPTLIGVRKDRRDGEDGLAALMTFDLRTRSYRPEYTLGRLTKGDTEWEPLKPSDVPRWARGHRQLEVIP